MLGERIRTLRKEHAISQEELAEKLGVSRQSISLWENEQTMPSMGNIVSIANIFGVSTDVLLKGTSSEAAETTDEATPIPSKRKMKVWEIVLLAIGSPLWLSLAIAAFAIAFSLYVVLWTLVVSLWAGFASVTACPLGFTVMGVGFACQGNVSSGIALIGAGVACIGLSIFLFFACRASTKGVCLLTKSMIGSIKNRLSKKEEAQ